MAGFNLADLFETVADTVPDREAVVAPARRLTYRGLDERANRLAHHLAAVGVQRGQHVGLQLVNGTEYLEGMLAAFKLGAVPVNVNFRYVEGELRHLYDDADLVALVYHRQFAANVGPAAAAAPALRQLLAVDDGSGTEPVAGSQDYEEALSAQPPGRPDGSARTGDDIYIAYTGGTTGLPKGVLWRQEDIFFAAMGGGDVYQAGNFIATPAEIAERVTEYPLATLTTPPLMHVSAQWGVYHSLFSGGKVVFPAPGRFDPAAVWSLVCAERVNILTIVGDAMARPLCAALAADRAGPGAWDVSSLLVVGSGGAVLSAAAKARLAELLPNVLIVDGFGSSETGVVGNKLHVAGDESRAARFTVNDQTNVLDEQGRPVAPGSGAVGRLARKGRVPLGYYKDAAKTAATFLTVAGERWVLPGDMATVEADGTVVLLGRGSVSINTGGEKVYPEEVESVLREHASVADAVVVGLPDDTWGERVVAVVAPADGASVRLADLQEHARRLLAGYKVPREVVVVAEVQRTPAGKADYRWAREAAVAGGGAAAGR